MRKKWLVIGGIGVALLLLILSLNIFRQIRKPDGNACEQLIQYAIKNDAKNSYSLLSDTAKSKTSESQWKKVMEDLSISYVKHKEHKLDSSSTLDIGDGAPQTYEQYVIKTTNGTTYRGSCYLDTAGNIDGYSTEIEWKEIN